MKALRTSVIAAAVVGLLAGTALQASARSTTEVTANRLLDEQSVVVNFADLNLNSHKGRDALYNRIARAADKLCGARTLRRAGNLAQVARNKACYKETISRAMSEIRATAVAVVN